MANKSKQPLIQASQRFQKLICDRCDNGIVTLTITNFTNGDTRIEVSECDRCAFPHDLITHQKLKKISQPDIAADHQIVIDFTHISEDNYRHTMKVGGKIKLYEALAALEQHQKALIELATNYAQAKGVKHIDGITKMMETLTVNEVMEALKTDQEEAAG